MNKLTDFYIETTKKFSVTITINDTIPDIRNDTVAIIFKRNITDEEEVYEKEADVTTQGENGIAIFEITDEEIKDVDPGQYYYEIYWDLIGGDKYVISQATIKLLSRVKVYT